MTGAPAPDRALIVLEDGTVQPGRAYGARGTTVGEIVFNTGMTGYQETLTDPSYHRQIVVMTAPHIGNTGVNDEDPESGKIWVAGYVVRDAARRASSWRAQRTLDEELAQGVVGISDVDTRALTRHLRELGVMRAGIFSGDALVRDGYPRTVEDLVAGEGGARDGRRRPSRGEHRHGVRRRALRGHDAGRRAPSPPSSPWTSASSR